MTCVIYREGKGTTEHGIECESTTCEIEHLDGLLDAGWSLNPPGYEPPEAIAPEELPVGEGKEEDDDADLVEQVASLTAQVEILNELDEKSREEIQRLTDELAKAEEDLEALADENIRLSEMLANITAGTADEDEDESNLNPVRIKAKEAGIEGWDTKRIGTLEKLLEA